MMDDPARLGTFFARANAVVRPLLKSPLHGLVSSRLMLLNYVGDEEASSTVSQKPDNETLKALNKNITDEFRANAGKVGGRFEGNEVLLLTTKGAKSGEPRVAPLVVFRIDGKLLIVAGYGGADVNPGWVHNLRANPHDPDIRAAAGRAMTGRRRSGRGRGVGDGEPRGQLPNAFGAGAPSGSTPGYGRASASRCAANSLSQAASDTSSNLSSVERGNVAPSPVP